MPKKKFYNKKTRRGRGIIDSIKNTYSKVKGKLGNINDYLKAKQFAKNIITDDINWGNPVRAISQAYGINKYLQKGFFNAPLQYLSAHGYGGTKKRHKRKK